MTTDTTALRALIEAVEAGDRLPSRRTIMEAMEWGFDVAKLRSLERAYDGSLDAAKALHGALLPGWRCTASYAANSGLSSACVFPEKMPQTGLQHALAENNPARAWLLAILKAKLGMAE